MEWPVLKHFVAVAEAGTISRAAEQLYISQPALSRQIRALEADLGFALFERESHRLQLTREGERFLEEARLMLANLDRVNEVIGDLRMAAVVQTGTGTAAHNPARLATAGIAGRKENG